MQIAVSVEEKILELQSRRAETHFKLIPFYTGYLINTFYTEGEPKTKRTPNLKCALVLTENFQKNKL